MNRKPDQRALRAIRVIAFDVDGVFTDGRFYLSDDGIESKAFHTQDGHGVRQMLKSGIQVAIISGRQSKAVSLRMHDLGVTHVVLGCADKVAAMQALLDQLNLNPRDCAYVGDDVPDLPLLRFAGYSFAVANAVKEVKAYCDHVTRASGGFGAVREIADLLCAARSDDNG